MFAKRPSELTPKDIQRVIDEAWQEGSQVELKGALPGRGREADPWMSDQSRVGDPARNKLVEEVIAFANAYGGWLLLGVEETSDKPARASSIEPLPACAELAERLRLMCRDCIEPQLPIFEAEGVPMAEDGSGVVVFHVPRSRMAPHRHTVTRECYVRRADRSEKMSMREIQDLTLQVERGLAAIERRFEDRHARFGSEFARFADGTSSAFGIRATLVPLTPIYVDRVHGNEDVSPPANTLVGMIGNALQEMPIPLGGGSSSWRPLIRGTASRVVDEGRIWSREAHCDGLIEYLVMFKSTEERGPASRPFYLPVRWVMGLFGNAVCAAEKFRRAAGATDIEYGLEFEIMSATDLHVGIYGYHSSLSVDMRGPLPPGSTLFPRYSVGPWEEFQQVSQAFERDFWNAAGLDPQTLLSIDFRRALTELGIAVDA